MMSLRVVIAVAAGAVAGYSAAAFRPPSADQHRELSRLEARLATLAQATEEQNRALSGLARSPSVVVERVLEDVPRGDPARPDHPEHPLAAAGAEETPEVLDTKKQGELLIAQATRAGVWTPADEEEFHELRMTHPNVDWTPVLTSLSAAMNNGRMVPSSMLR
jgi:hypothetical protein